MFRICAPVLLLSFATPLLSHEFWIDPDAYIIAPGETIEARFRNGENLKGVEIAFFDRRSARLEFVTDGEVTPIAPRNGDRPAINLPDMAEGLVVLAHETEPSGITYRAWEKFLKFAAHKDFPDIETRHDARGLPREGFQEAYTRHVKALVAVGDGEGADRALGHSTEFVAITNPYGANFTQTFKSQLFYQGQPRGDAQVEIFDKAPDGTVTVTLTRTDSAGFSSFPTKPNHSYLIDAVVLRAPAEPGGDYAWETLWAAMTFAVPN